MLDLLLVTSIEYGGYISIVKLIVFLVLFLLWLLLVCWVYRDSETVGTNGTLWTAIIFGAGAGGILIWLLVPFFIAGILFYLIAVGASAISYVKHRNAMVSELERILTAEHIKNLFSANKQEKLETMQGFVFITANNNDVPAPQGRTPEFFGYKAACDIFTDAMWRRASTIMYSPGQENYNVIYSIDGVTSKQPPIANDQMKYFSRFIKNMADLDPDERRKPQKGKFSIRQGKKNRSEWEVTTAGSTAGEQIKIKQITKGVIKQLPDIGLSTKHYEQLSKICEQEQGVFIVSGPKKSGVTTTFYALIRNHDAFLNSIETLEKQPFGDLPNVNQNIFTLRDTGTSTYAKKFQNIVRMGPDIVGVADCEDAETARIACTAAQNGKQVYVTLIADNVAQALAKWIKLVGNKDDAAEVLLGVSNQRLFRKLCDECKQAYEPNRELLKKFNLPAEKTKELYRAGKVQYTKRGKPITCENCRGTGFIDRMAVFENIVLNDELRELVKKSKSTSEINSAFRHAKMRYLQEQTLEKAISGQTSMNEMVRVLSASKKQPRKQPKKPE